MMRNCTWLYRSEDCMNTSIYCHSSCYAITELSYYFGYLLGYKYLRLKNAAIVNKLK